MKMLMCIDVPYYYEFNSMVEQTFNCGQSYVRRYHHNGKECDAEFSVMFRYKGYSNSYGDYKVTCPVCNGKSSNTNKTWPISFDDPHKYTPTETRVMLYELKNGYQIKAVSKANKFVSWWGKEVYTASSVKLTEFITFDVSKRKTTYKLKQGRTVIKEHELGSFYDNTLIENSMLLHINCRNGSRYQLKNFGSMMTILREGISRKFKKLHGYKLGNIYTRKNTTPLFGKIVPPIMFIAFRLLFPDIKDMPANILGDKIVQVIDNPDNKLAQSRNEFSKLFDNVDIIRKADNSIDGIIEAVGLPKTALIRHTVSKHPFHAPILSAIYKRIPKADVSVQLFDIILHKYSYSKTFITETISLMNSFIMLRPVTSIKAFLLNNDWARIRDIVGMSTEYKGDKSELYSMKLDSVHDWLTEKIYEQNHPDYSLNIPEPIKKRLEMQKDSLKFFLPDTAYELRAGGKEFHNCVYRYAKEASNAMCCIAFMADDKGKLVACLEIREGKLVQAKLKYNNPVFNDININNAIIDWCKKSGLEIATTDIMLKSDNAIEKATA